MSEPYRHVVTRAAGRCKDEGAGSIAVFANALTQPGIARETLREYDGRAFEPGQFRIEFPVALKLGRGKPEGAAVLGDGAIEVAHSDYDFGDSAEVVGRWLAARVHAIFVWCPVLNEKRKQGASLARTNGDGLPVEALAIGAGAATGFG
jgi:hypothetical protein